MSRGLNWNLVVNFVSTVTYYPALRRRLFGLLLYSYSRQDIQKVLTSEGPFKGFCDGFIPRLEREQPSFHFGKPVEIIRCERLSLHDREINLYLIERASTARAPVKNIWTNGLD